MNHETIWQKLVSRARQAPEGDCTVPVGFATRLAALGVARMNAGQDWVGMFAFRALVLAVAVMVTTAAVSHPWSPLTGGSGDAENDPVVELVAEL